MKRKWSVTYWEKQRRTLPRDRGLRTAQGWLYLAGVKDIYTCELVGYAMDKRMTKDLTSRALWSAVAHKRPPKGLIHHSDRGSQYGAHSYRTLLDQFGMKASMSRKGNCYDNAPMESFWGSLKMNWFITKGTQHVKRLKFPCGNI